MDENSRGQIHIYKAGPRGVAMQEQDRQIINSTISSSSRAITTSPQPLRLETNKAPGTKNS